MYNKYNPTLKQTKMSDEIKQDVLVFLQNNNLGYLSTVSKDNKPHCTAVFYIVEPDFSIYFISKSESQKAINISNNPFTAFTVAQKEQIPITTQLEGKTIKIEVNTEILHKLSQSALKGNDFFPPTINLPGSGLSLFKFIPSKIQWLTGNFSNDIKIEHLDLEQD